MKNAKYLYQYSLPDGREALSPFDLAHALQSDNCLHMESLTLEEQKAINIIANPDLAPLLVVAMDGEKYLPAEEALAMDRIQRLNLSYYRHCAVLHDGDVYLRDGEFKRLDDYINAATKDELKMALYRVAYQAAIAHMEACAKEAT